MGGFVGVLVTLLADKLVDVDVLAGVLSGMFVDVRFQLIEEMFTVGIELYINYSKYYNYIL